MRHKDLKVFFFDRHRGAEIFTRAVKGAYVGFDGDEKTCRSTRLTPSRRQTTVPFASLDEINHDGRRCFVGAGDCPCGDNGV